MIDHWLFSQWFVLAGHRKPEWGGMQEMWQHAYGANFTQVGWDAAWRKARRWMAL